MSTEVNVLSRTQIIEVEPVSKSVSIINAGPQGPGGPTAQRLLTTPVIGIEDELLITFERTILETDSFTPPADNWVKATTSLNVSFTTDDSSPIGFGTILMYVNDERIKEFPLIWFGPSPFLFHLDASAIYQADPVPQTVKLVAAIFSDEVLESLPEDTPIVLPEGLGLNVITSSPLFGSSLGPTLTVENLGIA